MLEKKKSYFAKTKPRVLVIGDAAYPLSTTGFAMVLAQVIAAFQRGGWEVVHFARGLKETPQPAPSYRVFMPPLVDANGYGYIDQICAWEHPDLIFINADPGSVGEFRRAVEVRRVPNLIYTPTEGGPLLPPWSNTIEEIIWMKGQVTTYTEFSRRVLEGGLTRVPDRPIEVLPHGLDHAPFRKMEPAERARLRQMMGWTDKFVVMNVARNAGRKMWMRLLEGAAGAAQHVPNLLLYAHTVAFENYILGGHNLLEARKFYHLEGILQFHDDLRDGTMGIPFAGKDGATQGVGLIELYNAADAFVSTSGAEGWNLPLCEAAACGLPVATPEYAGAWEATKEFATPIPVHDFETHPTGLRYAAVHPTDVEETIRFLHAATPVRSQRVAKGLQVTSRMKWQPTADRLVELAGELLEK